VDGPRSYAAGVALAVGLQRLLSWFAASGESWASAMLGPGFDTPLNVLAWIISIAAGLGVVFGAVFLMPAITTLVASVFVDDVADHVEREYYPAERPGTALPFGLAITEGVKGRRACRWREQNGVVIPRVTASPLPLELRAVFGEPRRMRRHTP
jgi:uncharacterized protein involved in cysteine biosynthesis